MKKNRVFVLITIIGLSCMGAATADEMGTGRGDATPDVQQPGPSAAMEWLQSLLAEWF